MATVDDLVAKALSTSSEDEAIACLRMARKRGGERSQPTNATMSSVNQNTKEYNDLLKITRQEIVLLRTHIELITNRYNNLRWQYYEMSKNTTAPKQSP